MAVFLLTDKFEYAEVMEISEEDAVNELVTLGFKITPDKSKNLEDIWGVVNRTYKQ